MRYDADGAATGPTATASSSPPATPRSSCTRCCTSPASGSPSTTSRQFRQWGSATPGHPEAHHTAGRRGHHRPARPGLRQRRRHGHRRALAAGPLRPRARRPPHLRHRRRRLTSRRASATRPPRSPATWASAGSSTSTTTTTSPSTAPPSWPCPTTPPSASRPTAGTSRTSARSPTTSTPSRPRCAGPWPSRTARRCSCCAATSATRRPSAPTARKAHGNPLDDEEIARHQGGHRPPAGRDLLRPRRRRSTSTARPAAGAAPTARPGRSAWPTPATGAAAWRRCLERPRPAPAGTRRLPTWEPGEKVATRVASAACLNAVARASCPAWSAAAPTSPATPAPQLKDGIGVRAASDPGGRQIHFGVREHGMGGVMNGMALHGGVAARRRHVPRLQRLHAAGGAPGRALRGQGHLLLDPRLGRPRRGRPDPPAGRAPRRAAGHPRPARASARPTPTRPPRPGGSPSTATGPTALILTRQDLPGARGHRPTAACAKGAYVLADPDGAARRRARRHRQRGLRSASRPPTLLEAEGVGARVVSMPCWDLFDDQDDAYQDVVLPAGVPTLAVEAGVTFGWDRWADDVVGIDRFGASAPGVGRARQARLQPRRRGRRPPAPCSPDRGGPP